MVKNKVNILTWLEMTDLLMRGSSIIVLDNIDNDMFLIESNWAPFIIHNSLFMSDNYTFVSLK